jgi:hypothetical protein
MVDRHIVPKDALELITTQKTVPSGSTIVILASDVLALREKLGFFEIIAKEHRDLLQRLRYSDNDEGDRDADRARETIRVINVKLAQKV